jgi:hypothetical protein
MDEMFTAIKALLDAVTSVLSGLSALDGIKERARKRKLAANLYMIYVVACEVMQLADQIIDQIESFNPADSPRYLRHFVSASQLDRQTKNLAMLRRLLSEQPILHAISADAAHRLPELLSEKEKEMFYMAEFGISAYPFAATPIPSVGAIIAWYVRFTGISDRRIAGDWSGYPMDGKVSDLRRQLADLRAALDALRAGLEVFAPFNEVATLVDQKYSRWVKTQLESPSADNP